MFLSYSISFVNSLKDVVNGFIKPFPYLSRSTNDSAKDYVTL